MQLLWHIKIIMTHFQPGSEHWIDIDSPISIGPETVCCSPNKFRWRENCISPS